MRRQGGDPNGKLERLARRWAGGRGVEQDKSEADLDCERFGIDPAHFAPLDAVERNDSGLFIWPDMQDSVAVFFAMGTQWNWVGAGMAGGFRCGLKYEVIGSVAAGNGIAVTPQLFNDIRTLELAALGYWNERRR